MTLSSKLFTAAENSYFAELFRRMFGVQPIREDLGSNLDLVYRQAPYGLATDIELSAKDEATSISLVGRPKFVESDGDEEYEYMVARVSVERVGDSQ